MAACRCRSMPTDAEATDGMKIRFAGGNRVFNRPVVTPAKMHRKENRAAKAEVMLDLRSSDRHCSLAADAGRCANQTICTSFVAIVLKQMTPR